MRIHNSLSLLEASRRSWDVIVVGGGPAGAMAAYELARRSLRVLLVDKSAFPRLKVCGCCLNGQALAILQARGLDHVIRGHGAVPLHQMELAAYGHRVVIPLPTGEALSREVLDMGLINAAIQSGAAFLSQTTVSLSGISSSDRQVVFDSNGNRAEARAAVVLAADGLGGTLSRAMNSSSPMPMDRVGSRIGAAVIIERGPKFYQPETIYMACGRGGYVGLVRLEDDRLNIAAAFDLKSLRDTGHPGRLAGRILHEAGFPSAPNLADMPWKGTPPLTHHARGLASERLFILGDAASFVEPFTGEGIAWALRSAIAVAPLAQQGVEAWKSELVKEWTNTYHREVERRQITCRLTTAALRHPWLTTVAIRLLALVPFLSHPVLRQINARHDFRTGISL